MKRPFPFGYEHTQHLNTVRLTRAALSNVVQTFDGVQAPCIVRMRGAAQGEGEHFWSHVPVRCEVEAGAAKGEGEQSGEDSSLAPLVELRECQAYSGERVGPALLCGS